MWREPADLEGWCLTTSQDIRFRFLWRLERFSLFTNMHTGYLLKSSTFSVGPSEETQWRMHLYPTGINNNHLNHVSAYCLNFTHDHLLTHYIFGKSCSSAKISPQS